MYFIGLDVHKKTISYCVKDATGRVYQEGIGKVPSQVELVSIHEKASTAELDLYIPSGLPTAESRHVRYVIPQVPTRD
jgi:hypothetical protein